MNVWDKIYSEFEKNDPAGIEFYSRLEKNILKYLKKGDSIIEVGCGSGFMVSRFQKNHHSVGLDLNKRPLEVAKNKFKVKKLIRANMLKMPIKDNSFNVVWNEGVIEHFKKDKALDAVKEMKRISKKYVIIAVPNKSPIYIIRKIILQLIGKWAYGKQRFYSKRELKKIMNLANLDIIKINYIKLAPPIREFKGIKSIFNIFLFTIVVPKGKIKKTVKYFSRLENKHRLLTKYFGYCILAVGIKKS